MGDNWRTHSCEDYDGECTAFAGYHGNVEAPMQPWERTLLGRDGMILEATREDGSQLTFENVAIDSARMERNVLVFENDDTSTKVKVFYVPNVSHWTTFYR